MTEVAPPAEPRVGVVGVNGHEGRNGTSISAGTQKSEWKTTESVPLTRESFLDLLYGRTPLVCSPHFISDETSKRLLEHLTPKFDPEKVGIAQFEFQAQSEEDFKNRKGDEKQRYFDEVRRTKSLHPDVSKVVGENAWAKVIATIAELVPEWDVGEASEGPGNEYFSGIFRKLNKGTPIHCDWAPYDAATEDWVLNKITHQAAVNLYLSPFKGGGTTVFDVQWSEDALNYRDPAHYGYHEALVKGRKKAPFQPRVGGLYMFNARNMHQVAALAEDYKVQRITLASFIGLLPSEVTGGKPKLIFWS
ncbi:Uu.00g026250.m01.CDS01 [Anthostomella pinea]|uniref:Uu.00g026250.m01.CDS01 n=1 Tax=Anthostomella pinea TaxID=933095 RepID=A0AAI8YCK7_9PEZI|nr:Uu.00g026250.m01.CDS01 [Anthostomella pinea]